MATNTPHFNLIKPAQSDAYNVDDFNDNADILDTELKTLSTEVAEAKKSASDGKTALATAITQQGVATAATDTFAKMAANILAIITGSGNAIATQVLTPYTFTNSTGIEQVGTMPNNGAISATLNAGVTYTVANGYHNGSGKVVATSLSAQTAATAVAAYILAGYTAWVNGVKITGTIASKAAATYTPGTSAQTIAAGQYLSGAQTIGAIPSNYYNANTQQTVFSYGTFGLAASLGAYYTSYGVTGVYSDSPVDAVPGGGIALYRYTTPAKQAMIFRAAFPKTLKYVQITVRGVNTVDYSLGFGAFDPDTKKIAGGFSYLTWYGNAAQTKSVGIYLANSIDTIAGDSWFLYITNNGNETLYNNISGPYGILEIKLSPTAF